MEQHGIRRTLDEAMFSLDPIGEEPSDPIEDERTLVDEEDDRIEHIRFDNQLEHAPKRLRAGYKCDVCGTSYTEKCTLIRHQRTVPAHCKQAGIPLVHYPCEHCHRNFSRRDLRQRHDKEVHSNIKRPTPQNRQATTGPSITAHSDRSTSSPIRFYDSSITTADDSTSSPSIATAKSMQESLEQVVRVVTEYRSNDTAMCIDNSGPQDFSLADEDESRIESNTGSTNGPAMLQQQSDRLEQELSRPEAETASIQSVSSVNSMKSAFRAMKPLPRAYLIYKGAAPRWHNNKRPMLCALCQETLGHSIAEVRAHLDQHSKTIEGGFSCQTCQIRFTHERDFERHQTAASHGHCGFDFDHAEPCQGHHPPDIFSEMLTDNDRMQFSHRLLHWEQMQLRTYLDQVSDLISGDPLTLEDDCWSMGGLYSSLVSLPSILGERKPGSALEPGSYKGRSSRARLPFNWRVKATALALLDSSKLRSPRNLAVAAKSGDKEEVRWLIDSGADVNTVYECKLERSTKEPQFVYPLEAAIYGGDLETVEVLIDRGARVNGWLTTCPSPLHYCVRYRRLAIARLLIERGADSMKNPYYQPTALHGAVVTNQEDMVEVMLEHATDVYAHPEPTAALSIAISLGYTDMVHLLLGLE